MNFFSNLQIKFKMFVVFSVILLVFTTGFLVIFFSLQTIHKATGDIYNEGLIGVERLLEADRDAYQSSLAIAQSLSAIRQGNKERIEKLSVDALDNLGQINDRFSVFEKVYLDSGRAPLPIFDVFKTNYKLMQELTDRIIIDMKNLSAGEILTLSSSTVTAAVTVGDLLNQLVPDIKRTAELIQEISSATMEQRTGVQQTSSALDQLNIVIQQNSSSSEELASTAEELSAQSEHLSELLKYFTV